MTPRRSAVLLVLATAASWAAAPAYAAADDPVTGYWARTRTALPVPVPPPDTVPEGGTWVAGEPTGPVAVSALRTDLPVGLVAVELRLTVADAVGNEAVQACPSTDRWVPEQGGRLEGAPEADCSAPLDAALDGDVLVVPLPPGLDAVNVLLRPAPGSAFSLTLERATAASVVTAPAPSTGVPPSGPPPAGPPTTGTAQPPAFTGPVAPAFDAPLAGVGSGPLLASPTLPEPVAAQPAPAPQTAPVPVAVAPAAQRPAVPADNRRQALLAAGILLLLMAQAVRLARQPATAPRALGGAARRHRSGASQVVVSVDSRGVGRFRAARTRPPVRL